VGCPGGAFAASATGPRRPWPRSRHARATTFDLCVGRGSCLRPVARDPGAAQHAHPAAGYLTRERGRAHAWPTPI
jgi:hypothetical protein